MFFFWELIKAAFWPSEKVTKGLAETVVNAKTPHKSNTQPSAAPDTTPHETPKSTTANT